MASFPTSPQPLRTFTFGAEHKVLVNQSEDGYEQRRYIWPAKKRKFTLYFDVLAQDEMQTILDFYNNTASGIYNTFNYTFKYNTNSAEEVVTCRFANEEITFNEFTYRRYSTELNLIEVW